MAKTIAIIGVDRPKEPEGVRVKPPEGFEWPEGADPKEGEKFMVTATMDDNGDLILKDLDGLPLKPMPPKPDEMPEPDEDMSAGDVFASALKKGIA